MESKASPVRRTLGAGPQFFWGLAFVLAYLVARLVLEATSLHIVLRLAVAAVPVPLFAMWLIAWMRCIRSADELERRIQLEALALAFPCTLLLLMALGMVQLVVVLPEANFSFRHVWAMLPIFYFLGLWMARRRYT